MKSKIHVHFYLNAGNWKDIWATLGCHIVRHSLRPPLWPLTLSHIISSPLRSRECWRHPEPETPGEKDRTRGNTDVPPWERTRLFLLVSAAPGGRSEIHGLPPEGEYHRRLRNAKKPLFYWIFQRRTQRFKDPAGGVGGLCRVLLRQLLPTSVQTPIVARHKPPRQTALGSGTEGMCCLVSKHTS